MSVVINKETDVRCNLGSKCTFCGEKLRAPFVVWDCMPSETDLKICAACCGKIKSGHAADIVQVAAIAELHSLGYRGHTLERQVVT
jgi:hypothetical protein